MITATNEDNMLMMKRYPDNHFDLAMIDAEYGIGESNSNFNSRNTPIKQKNGKKLNAPNSNYVRKNWDNKTPSFCFFSQVFRTSKNQCFFGANYYHEIVGNTFKPPRRDKFNEFIINNPIGWIIWDKMNGNSDFNDCELVWSSLGFKSFIVKYMWSGMFQGSKGNGEIMEGNKKLNEKRIHPTQKPVRIYEKIYSELRNRLRFVFNIILDTNTGSNSNAIACYNMGFDLIGSEIDKDYYTTGNKRLKQHQSQLTIFDAGA